MLASLFSKTRPFNYVLTGFFVISAFFLFQFTREKDFFTSESLVEESAVFLLLIASFILVNFISLRNALTKNDNYAILLFLIFVLMFPGILENWRIVLSNFFLLLALRRLISLRTLNSPKEKIFDASFWIFFSALFHFWSIAYIILVFISIIFHSGKDYKNWLIPFISLFCVWILHIFFSLFFLGEYELHFQEMIQMSFDFTGHKTTYENMALASYVSISVLFFASQILDYQNKPLNMQSSYKQVYFSFLLAIGIYALSKNKTNDMLIYSFATLAILGANMFEKLENNNFKEASIYILFAVGVCLFVLQL